MNWRVCSEKPCSRSVGSTGPLKGMSCASTREEMRQRAHLEEHFFQQARSDMRLREFCRDVQAADKSLLIFENVERIAGRDAVFEGYAAGQRVGIQEALNQIESAAIVPVQIIAPVASFFLKQRLESGGRKFGGGR